jgi:tRNA (uracil-5-)-methyltransferase
MTVLAGSRFSSIKNNNNLRFRRQRSSSPLLTVFCVAATTVMFMLAGGRVAQAWTATTLGVHRSLVTKALATTTFTSARTTRTTKLQQQQQQQQRPQSSRLYGRSNAASRAVARTNERNSDNYEDGVKVPANFISYPFTYRQEVDIKIESLTHRGWGVGRLAVEDNAAPVEVEYEKDNPDNVRRSSNKNKYNDDDDDNVNENDATTYTNNGNSSNSDDKRWVVMVPNVIIGELVKVRIFRNFKSYSEADLVEVLEFDVNQSRVEPLCPLAETCGGCQLQHMNIDSQREWKTSFVQQLLAQYNVTTATATAPAIEGGASAAVVTVQPCLGTDEIYGYRSKLTPHYQAPAKRKRGTQEKTPVAMIDAIGFQKQTNRAILDVPHCPIATPAINRRYQELRHELLLEPPNSKKGATLLLRQANVDLDDDSHPEAVTVHHQTYLTTRVRGLEFSYLAGNFFQNNLYVLPLMVDHVLHHAATVSTGSIGMDSNTDTTDSTTDTTMTTHLVDCYCGSGLFAVSAAAAPNAQHHLTAIVGIEINDRAVLEATNNAIKNNVSAVCRFVAATAEGIFDQIQDFPRDTTCTILDPPRKGCSPDFLAQLFQFGPAKIVYMSCDPSTQARDAQDMVAAGYTITSVQPFDLFPQTRHIECLMVLERTASVRNN